MGKEKYQQNLKRTPAMLVEKGTPFDEKEFVDEDHSLSVQLRELKETGILVIGSEVFSGRARRIRLKNQKGLSSDQAEERTPKRNLGLGGRERKIQNSNKSYLGAQRYRARGVERRNLC